MEKFKRLVDELGRIVLPRGMGIAPGEAVLIYKEGGKIIIVPSEPACKVCGSTKDVREEMPLCSQCISKAKKL